MINGKETKLSEAVGVKDLRNMAGFIDDQDPRITYLGSWGNWNEAVNYAGTIKFIETPVGTETASLTFVGTGIEVITCTNSDRGKFEVSIDGVVQGEVDTYTSTTKRQQVVYSKKDIAYGKHIIKLRATNIKSNSASNTKVELDAFNIIDSTIQEPKGNFSLAGSASGDDQQKIAEFKDLENIEHTIVMIGVERAGKRSINLDYFKVIKPLATNIVDKVALQVEIQEQSKKVEDNYTPESWNNFKNSYTKAIEVMNNDNSTAGAVAIALAELKAGVQALIGQEASDPIIPNEAKVESIGIESKTLMLKWPVINKVVRYEIYNVNSEEEVKIGETTNSYYRVPGVTPDTSYRFVVRAISELGKSSDFEVCTVKTASGKDTEMTSDITTITLDSISNTTAHITWSESSDNTLVIGYRVYLNGVLQDEVNKLAYEFNDLNEGEEYTVKVLALDEAGNTSLIPVSIKFTPKSKDIVVSKVEDLKVVETTKDSVTLSWNSPISLVGLVEYIIYKYGKNCKYSG